MSQQPNDDDATISPDKHLSLDKTAVQPGDSFSTSGERVGQVAEGEPEFFGRHRVISLLGKGGFGAVYRAVDTQLQRDVAIKVTHGSMLDTAVRKNFLTEARIVAALDHPNIVPVYDVGQTDTGDFFVVSKLIDGSDLASRIKVDRPDRILSLRIIEHIADALNYAHAKGLVHRDVKPANILLDRQDRPYLTDFGIALRESDRHGPGKTAGTPAYMSPEKARGEGHRIDNRSDIYSLGIVLYELLTGRHPFRSDNSFELMKLIATEEVRSPRQFDDSIPPDIERICLKSLARRASDRFTVARDVAEEIRWLLANHAPTPGTRPSILSPSAGVTPVNSLPSHTSDPAARSTDSQSTGPTRIVPKGLRSFDASDASFFLELLPGPFDREGLPEGLRFWKTRIEETDPDRTFKVGLVYGPSGCGKSSLMKAGLLPRLSSRIISIYIEATADDTETRLLRAVRRAIPDAEGTSLKEVLSIIRRRKLVPTGGKLLLVIDQFEQWLFAEKNYAKASLTEALLQCDGGVVQAIVMVRDDFWLSVSRFLKELDIPILERENSALVDLFDKEHASKVLGLFGRAYGKLPDSSKQWTNDQHEFIRRAIVGLSNDGKVISVQIAVLADMMKQKPWTTATLNDVGGIEGVGVTFLEEMFGSRHAPIQHRQHEEAVRGLLSALLPTTGADIKGSKQSAVSLQKAAGYEQQPTEFQSLIEILDKNLRLITPVDANDSNVLVASRSEFDPSSDAPLRLGQTTFYQLAHDYMVPSLRDWLTQKQRETKRGRAELKLAERTAVWGIKKENKQLPTLIEWFQIRRWTDKKRWSMSERSLMRTAARVHARNWSSSILVLLIVGGVVGFLFQQQSLRSQQEKIAVALDSLQKTLGPAVPVNIDKLIEMEQPELIRSELRSRYLEAIDPREKLSLAFALASFGQVETDYLASQLDSIEDRDTGNLIEALGNDPAGSIQKLQQLAKECNSPGMQRRKARLALVALGIGDTVLPIDACEFEGRTDHGVRTWFIDEFRRWELDRETLVATVENSTSPALRSAVCLGLGQIPVKQISTEDRNRISQLATKWYSLPDSSTHSAVTWLMRQWEITEPKLPDATQMVEGRNWFVNSQGVTFVRITPPPISTAQLPDPLEKIRQTLDQLEKATEEEKSSEDHLYTRGKSYYFVGQYELALEDFDTVVSVNSDEAVNEVRRQTEMYRLLALARLKHTEEAEAALADWRANKPDPTYLDYVESLVPLWLGRKDAAVARLEQGLARADSADVGAIYNLARAVALFSAFESTSMEEKQRWIDQSIALLERWLQNERSDRAQMRGDPNLSILHSDPRFVELATGLIVQPYWLSNREVTRGEMEAFLNDTSYEGEKPTDAREATSDESISPTLDHPAQNVSWFDAVMYCNWLSHREGRRPVYRYVGKKKVKDYDNREVELDHWEVDETANGYRLPDASEWEFGCRAGSETDWSSGSDESLLAAYCQMYPSKQTSPCAQKLPNAWGLHDMHGNVWEWCWNEHDTEGSHRLDRGGSWTYGAVSCQSAFRLAHAPSDRFDNLGFRVALSSAGIPK